MSLDTLVQVTISTETATITQAGFGMPLVAAYHTNFPERVRTYEAVSALADMVLDGFTTLDPAYQQAAAILSQSPRPPQIMVGRLAETPVVQTITATVDTAVEGVSYSVDINGTVNSYTAGVAETAANIIAALKLLVDADTLPAVFTDNLDGTVTIAAAAAGTMFSLYLSDDSGSRKWSRDDVTTDPGYATDLAAIVSENNSWYGLSIESHAATAITSVAAWAETNRKLFAATSGDTDILGSGSTDIASTEQALSHAYIYTFYSDRPHQYVATGLMGAMFPYDPGSETWAHKTISGSSVVPLSATEVSNAQGKNCNTYTATQGQNTSFPGKTASGEYIDIVRFVDWLKARIQEAVFAALVSSRKIPYTAAGIAVIEAAIRGVLLLGIRRGGLAEDPAPDVSVPDVATIATADKSARILRDVNFSGTLAGAIHTLVIAGRVAA